MPTKFIRYRFTSGELKDVILNHLKSLGISIDDEDGIVWFEDNEGSELDDVEAVYSVPVEKD